MADKTIKYDDTVVYENGEWVDSSYQNIEVTGGDDATNTTLINTLAANAEGGIKMPKTKTEALEALQKNPQEYAATIAGQLERIEDSKIVIVSKVNELGLNTETDITIDDAALAVNEIVLHNTDLTLESTRLALPEGYYKGVAINLGDVSDQYELQERSVTPIKGEQIIQPEEGFYGLSKVTVAAIPAAYQDVTSVTATADKVLVGSKFVDANGQVVDGAMVNNGKVEATLDVNNTSFTVAQGYHNGEGSVKIELEEKSVTIENLGTSENDVYTVTPTNGSVISQVTIDSKKSDIIGTWNTDGEEWEKHGLVRYEGLDDGKDVYALKYFAKNGIIYGTDEYNGVGNLEGSKGIIGEIGEITGARVTSTASSFNKETGVVDCGSFNITGGYILSQELKPESVQLNVKTRNDIVIEQDSDDKRMINVVVPTGYYQEMIGGQAIAEIADRIQLDTTALVARDITLEGSTVKYSAQVSEGWASDEVVNKSVALVDLDPNFVAGNIAAGKTVLGVEGTFTADANATAAQILEGSSAYVNGAKVDGTMANLGSVATTVDALNSDATGMVIKSVGNGYTTGGEIKLDNSIYNRLAAI